MNNPENNNNELDINYVALNNLPREGEEGELPLVDANPHPEGMGAEGAIDEADDADNIQPGMIIPARSLFAKIRANKGKFAVVSVLGIALLGYLIYWLIHHFNSKNADNTDSGDNPDEPPVNPPYYPFPVDPILCAPMGEAKLEQVNNTSIVTRMRSDYPPLGNLCQENDPKASYLPYELYGNFADYNGCNGRLNMMRGIFASSLDEAIRLSNRYFTMVNPNLAGTPTITHLGPVDMIECHYPYGYLFNRNDPDYTCAPPYLFVRIFLEHTVVSSHREDFAKTDKIVPNATVSSTQEIKNSLQRIKSESKNLPEQPKTISKSKNRKNGFCRVANSTDYSMQNKSLMFVSSKANNKPHQNMTATLRAKL